VICVSRKLSKMNFIWHEYHWEWKGVISGFVDDTQGVQYTLLNTMNVGSEPQQPSL
jgi:hypothetical protein